MQNPDELAASLAEKLAALDDRGELPANPERVAALAASASRFSTALQALTEAERQLLHTADSGFAAAGSWVDDAIADIDSKMANLCRGAAVLSGWAEPGGFNAERQFLVRGVIRGWAHRWRIEERGPTQVGSDKAFMAFAADCLERADVDVSNIDELVGNALAKDWRTR